MRTLFIILLLSACALAQSGTKFAWDYTQQQVIAGNVVRFEMEIDGDGNWVNVGMNLLDPNDPDTYFTPIPSGAIGAGHTVEIRACSVQNVCSTPQLNYELTATQTDGGGTIPVGVVP